MGQISQSTIRDIWNTLDIDNPRWLKNLEKINKANMALGDVAKKKGIGPAMIRIGARLRAGIAFVSLITIPSKSNTVPESTRLEPVY